MKKLNELIQKRAEITEEIQTLIDSVEVFTEEQRASLDALEAAYDATQADVEVAEAQEERNAKMASVQIRTGSIEDNEGTNLKRGLEELFTKGHIVTDFRGSEGFLLPDTVFRADPILSTTNAGIMNKIVSPDLNIKKSYGEEFLRDLGVRFYEGVNGNLVLPSMVETTATLTAESGNATSASQAPTSTTLSAKRIDVVQGYNREFLAQTSTYDGLLQDLVDSIGVQMVYTFFDNMQVDAVDASVQTTASISYDDILGLEANLADVMGDIKFAGTPAFKQYLKNMNAGSANIKFGWSDNNEVIGLPAMAANGVNANQLWLGDWSKSAQALFGGMEIIVDPYSTKKAGKVEVYAVQLADSGTANYRNFSWLGDASIG
jgi:hypothetical protein